MSFDVGHGLSNLEDAIKDFKQGKMVILVDREDRENEGDLVVAAEFVNKDAINFMSKEGRGLICVPLTKDRLNELDLGQMVTQNTEHLQTAFTVSVDAAHGTSTGISASDRAKTVKALIDPKTKPVDLSRPGHIFPLKARKGGVLVRTGQTEGSIDLCRLSGLYLGAVICEIMNDDGSMARMPDLQKFAEKHDLKIISVAQIIEYRRKKEKLVHRISEAKLPTKYGNFKIITYENDVDDLIHIALVFGDIKSKESVLVRVHSECLTGDVFTSLRCDCGEQLQIAFKMISEEGRGVCLYMRQEGRGIGLHNKIKAYELQDKGMDTVEANEKLGFKDDLRDYGIGAQMLKDLGLTNIRLLTNNPKKIVAIKGYHLNVTNRIPIICTPNEQNKKYLTTKQKKMGHFLDM